MRSFRSYQQEKQSLASCLSKEKAVKVLSSSSHNGLVTSVPQRFFVDAEKKLSLLDKLNNMKASFAEYRIGPIYYAHVRSGINQHNYAASGVMVFFPEAFPSQTLFHASPKEPTMRLRKRSPTWLCSAPKQLDPTPSSRQASLPNGSIRNGRCWSSQRGCMSKASHPLSSSTLSTTARSLIRP